MINQPTNQPAMDSAIPSVHDDAPSWTQATPPSTPPMVPKLTVNDTPIKLASASTLPFTTHHQFRMETYHTLGREIEGHLLGPMPIEQFLSAFFPATRPRNTRPRASPNPSNPYKDTVSCQNETAAYEPFVSSNHCCIIS